MKCVFFICSLALDAKIPKNDVYIQRKLTKFNKCPTTFDVEF